MFGCSIAFDVSDMLGSSLRSFELAKSGKSKPKPRAKPKQTLESFDKEFVEQEMEGCRTLHELQ